MCAVHIRVRMKRSGLLISRILLIVPFGNDTFRAADIENHLRTLHLFITEEEKKERYIVDLIAFH